MTVCQYFLKGTCRFDDRCRFIHPTPEGFHTSTRTVCQHFLRGNCRFGDRCRNEHPGGGNSSFGSHAGFSGNRQSGFSGQHLGTTSLTSSQRWQSGQRDFGQNRFGVLSGGSENSGHSTFGGEHKPISSQDAGHTASQIQQTIKRDLDSWEVSNQWPLSCYTYGKGLCISGLTDCSPEELRLEAYKCNAEGKPAVYQQGLSELLGTHKQRRDQFRTMSVAQIHDVVVKASEGVAEDSGFSSVFRGSEPQAISSSQGTSGIFSGMAATSAQPGGSFPAQQSSGPFSSTSQTGGELFGRMTTPQGSSQMFGSSSTQLGGLFGNQPKSDDGSSMATEPSGFGTVPGSSQSVITFGSGFASGVSGSENPGTTVAIVQSKFGNTGQGSVTASPHATSTIQYSDEDLAAFKAPMFTLGKIPECPPPLELC